MASPVVPGFERGASAAGTPGRTRWLGVEGAAAALLLILTAALLSATQLPGLEAENALPAVPGLDPAATWLLLGAGGTGMAAGVAGLLGLWRRRPRAATPAEENASFPPPIADDRLARIEQTALRLEQGFALLPQGLAAHLEELPAQVAASVAAEHAAADARLLQRVEAMGASQNGQGYDGTLRLASLVQRLERVGEALVSLGELMPQRVEQVAGGLEARLGMSVPPLLDRLEELARPIEAAGNTLARQAGAVEEALARALAEQQAQLGGLADDVARTIREETATFTAALSETSAAEARLWSQRVEEAAGLLQQGANALAAAAWPAVEAQGDILSARIAGAAEAAGTAIAELAGTVPEAVIPVLHARMAEVLQGQLIDPLQARLALMVAELHPPTEALSRLAAALPSRCEAMAEAVAAPADIARRLEAASLALESAAREATLALAGNCPPKRQPTPRPPGTPPRKARSEEERAVPRMPARTTRDAAPTSS